MRLSCISVVMRPNGPWLKSPSGTIGVSLPLGGGGAKGEAHIYEGVSKSFRSGLLERELQMVQLSAMSCIAILWVSLVSFAAITLCVVSQWVFIVYFVIESVRELLDTLCYLPVCVGVGNSTTTRSQEIHRWILFLKIPLTVENVMANPTPFKRCDFNPLPWE
jgi:hypothetical protein